MAIPKKKPPADDFALLLGGPEEDPAAEMGEGMEDDYADDEFGEDPGMEPDPLAAESDMDTGIDPEQARLAETLGFTEPEQQQALIDLIRLVNGPGASEPMFPESSI